jgi:general secretion pathway protein D
MKLNLVSLATLCGIAPIVTTAATTLPAEQKVSEVIRLKHEPAADVAAALNSLTTNYHSLGTNWLASKPDAQTAVSNAWANVSDEFKARNSRHQANAGASVQELGSPAIIPDEAKNALLIFASKDDLKVLKEAIAKLDAERERILIEAVVCEVVLKGTNSSKNLYFNESTHLVPGARKGNTSTFQITETNGDLAEMLKQLAAHQEVRILQRPRIETADGIAASLYVGDGRYSSKPNAGDPRNRADETHHSLNDVVGVTLEVAPTITPARRLTMNIAQTLERYTGSTNIADIGNVPMTTRQSLQTEVTVADRQTLLLAGPTELTWDKPQKGVPVLKSTPLIGGLFRNHPKQVQRQTLLALRATILPQQQAKIEQRASTASQTNSR